MFSHPVPEILREKKIEAAMQRIRFLCSATRWNTMDDSISHVCSSDTKKLASKEGPTADEHISYFGPGRRFTVAGARIIQRISYSRPKERKEG